MLQFLPEAHQQLSTDVAASIARKFLRQMAQPQDPEAAMGTSLLSLAHVEELTRQLREQAATDGMGAIAPDAVAV